MFKCVKSVIFPKAAKNSLKHVKLLINLSAVLLLNPSIFRIKLQHIHYLHKLIYLVATSSPLSPNITHIASDIGMSKEYIYNYLDYLQKANLFSFLHKYNVGLKFIRKPQKIYLNNSNLYHAIEKSIITQANIGSIREAFALNQLQNQYKVFDSSNGDFLIDNK